MSWGGRISDKELTLSSGFLNDINFVDMVMGDRGFLISLAFAVLGSELVSPLFTYECKQLPGKVVSEAHWLSAVRTHVE